MSGDPYEPKYEYLIKKWQEVGQKHFKDHKAFVEHSKCIKGVFKSIEEYSLGKDSMTKWLLIWSLIQNFTQ